MISLPERQQSRLAIRRLKELHDQIEEAMETGRDLPLALAQKLRQLTETDSIAGHLAAITHMRDTTEAEYRRKLLKYAPRSLSCFAEYMFPDEPPAHHHEFMCEKLEGIESREIMRMMISMPPGHAKSRYCSIIFPAWYMGKHPKHKYIQGGYGQEFVEKNFGMKVKGIIETTLFLDVFPGLAVNNELKANGYWGLVGTDGKLKGRALGEYVTRGVGQGIAGFRANCAGLDDPYANRKEAESPAKIKEVYDWFSADLTPRLLPNSPLFVVATRWTTRDLCSTIEEWNKEKRGIPWDIINLPAIATQPIDILGRSQGDPLWPEFYDSAHLLNLISVLPPRDWNSLYMGSPVDEEGGTLKGSMIQTYDTVIAKENVRRTVLSVDCANKNNERADYSVITVWQECHDRRHYLIDVVRRRVEFGDLVKMIDETARKHNANAILVEDKGAGTQYIQTRAGLAPAPVIPIEPGANSKEFRFDAVTPMFEAGEVLLPKLAPWMADYTRELMTFPDAAHDDQVDSTSQYLSWARRSRAGGTRKLIGAGATSQQSQMHNHRMSDVKPTNNVVNGG
jgi:predicted phage terminase large subunit-like protein